MLRNDKKIIRDITNLAATFLDVTTKDINSSNRRRDLVACRMAISNFLIRDLGFKYNKLELAFIIMRVSMILSMFIGLNIESFMTI